jgi:hypothetical protein
VVKHGVVLPTLATPTPGTVSQMAQYRQFSLSLYTKANNAPKILSVRFFMKN